MLNVNLSHVKFCETYGGMNKMVGLRFGPHASFLFAIMLFDETTFHASRSHSVLLTNLLSFAL